MDGITVAKIALSAATYAIDKPYDYTVPEEAAEAIPYYVAAILLTDEDVNLSQLFFNLYADKVSVLERGGSLRIHNTLFGGRRG